MLRNELVEIVELLWKRTLKLPLQQLSSAEVRFEPNAPLLTASIRFGGSFPALLSLTCHRELASSIAAAMFQTRAERVSQRDVHDALGEVINILGGNLKAVLSPSCQLALPSVAEGDVSPEMLLGPSVETLGELAFETVGQPFALRLLKPHAP
jgi:chemotaxis protein CheX